MRRARTVTLLAILLLIVLAALAGLRRLRQEPVAAAEETFPTGRWHRAAPDSPADAVERARLLSLPYLAGRQPPPA
ncbi:MAG TPA: hypothetical protein PK570_07840, partial [Thermoanaerobaculia bacterium]|nr:hypothetical protein [Thermoanaerobaculia bacterium]